MSAETKVSTGAGVQILEVDEASTGQRVDNYLIKIMKGVPKTRIYRCIRKGEVRVNKKRVQASDRLEVGDQVRIPPVRMANPQTAVATEKTRSSLEQAVLFENSALIVVNKPTGMAVHGGSGISLGVIETLRQMRPDARYLELVHRLDRETSGCLMIAKKPKYLKALQALLQNKNELEKHYLCIVHGRWAKRKQVVNLPLAKNVLASGERISRVQPDGKASLTEYDVLATGQGLSLVAARPVTGRTHQIRVHCTSAGYPIVGDSKYGDESKDKLLEGRFRANRLMLHAARLELPPLFEYPSLSVSASPDERFQNLIEYIKQEDSKIS